MDMAADQIGNMEANIEEISQNTEFLKRRCKKNYKTWRLN